MLKPEAYQRKPFEIEAVQVTLENFTEVVQWCGGTQRQDEQGRAYIKIDVRRAANTKQTMAYETDWVLKATTGFRVYTDYAFHKSFEPIGGTVVDPYQQQTGNVFELPGVDRKVVEKPVGDEKLIQGESVETVVEPSTAIPAKQMFRTSEELRKSKLTVPEKWPPVLDDETARQAWAAEHGHQPASNPDDTNA